ncbi:MAG TPA: Rho termination factor N-terminal domain-containing protein [Solirubrobacterales bacterium]|nr:Rho termination factor N-terminal domain-containing protein [Solirubrobacterales bacterium]
MTKTELEAKHLSDLHQLAADAGVERYRMLTRAELIERLSDGNGNGATAAPADPPAEGARERPARRRRRSASSGREREARLDVEEEEEKAPEPTPPEPVAPAREDEDAESSRPRRRRRRRRFGRRRTGVTIQDLLLPPESGRQAVLLADSRESATELLRGVAADLAAASDGPDPVALLIDPSPEELADWKREAPRAELVSAGQSRHASDALSQARRRAAEGEDVILLVDSLTRFAESFGDADGAKELFDAGRADAASGKGSLTVVAALVRD